MYDAIFGHVPLEAPTVCSGKSEREPQSLLDTAPPEVFLEELKLDSSHMYRTAIACKNKNLDFVSVHDSYVHTHIHTHTHTHTHTHHPLSTRRTQLVAAVDFRLRIEQFDRGERPRTGQLYPLRRARRLRVGGRFLGQPVQALHCAKYDGGVEGLTRLQGVSDVAL